MTRRSTFNLLKIQNFKSKIQTASYSYSGAKLSIIHKQNSFYPKVLDEISISDIQRIAHEIRDLSFNDIFWMNG